METTLREIYHIKQWENRECGQFELIPDNNHDYLLTFRKVSPCSFQWEKGYGDFEWRQVQHKKLFAKGFIVFLLDIKSKEDRKIIDDMIDIINGKTINDINNKYKNIPSIDIYDNYYNVLLKKYIEEEEKTPDAFKRNFDNEFYSKHIKEEADKYNYSKQFLFPYLTREQQDEIQLYIDNYFEYIKKYETKLRKVDENKKNTHSPQRTINTDKLKDYFVSSFNGMGSNINYFDTLIDELKTDRTAKEFAQIAFMIYVSKQMCNRKPKTFAGWYKIFCEYIGIKQVKGYKPNNLKVPSEAIKKLFNYLL
jgi:hypothetical protein